MYALAKAKFIYSSKMVWFFNFHVLFTTDVSKLYSAENQQFKKVLLKKNKTSIQNFNHVDGKRLMIEKFLPLKLQK